MKSERVQKLCGKMKEYGVDQVIVTSKANVFYFSGAYMDPMRRLLALIMRRSSTSFGILTYLALGWAVIKPKRNLACQSWSTATVPPSLIAFPVSCVGSWVSSHNTRSALTLGSTWNSRFT